MTQTGPYAWYIYAICATSTQLDGVEGILPNVTIDSVAIGRLFVLASLVPRNLFDREDPEHRTSDADWMAERVAAHHGVNDAAAGLVASLPLAIGTVFSTLERLEAWLLPRRNLLGQALAQVAGRREWLVTLTESVTAHAAWLDQHDEDLKQLNRTVALSGEGTAFLIGRRIDKARAAARASNMRKVAARVEHRLIEVVDHCLPERRRDGTPAWSVLADTARKPDAVNNASLADLAESLEPMGLSLRITGPWPAYAFAKAALSEEMADA
jgi:hypothetical protein